MSTNMFEIRSCKFVKSQRSAILLMVQYFVDQIHNLYKASLSMGLRNINCMHIRIVAVHSVLVPLALNKSSWQKVW